MRIILRWRGLCGSRRRRKREKPALLLFAFSRDATRAIEVSFRSLMVQRDQWGAYWGLKGNLLSRGRRRHWSMAAAPVESCQFVALRSPWGRVGSVLYTCNRLRRKRGRFDRWIHISTGPQPDIGLEHKSDNFSIQSSLGSPKHRRMRRRRLTDPRPIPEGVREPIYIRKK